MSGAQEFTFETPGARWTGLGLSDSALTRLETLAPRLESLVLAAREAKSRAYAPYSTFRVGAALSMNGVPFTGCNVENASYGGTLCAERTAIATAVAAGHRQLDLIAVSTNAAAGAPLEQRSPCGLCRQAMGEFASPDMLVLLDAGDDADGRLLGEVLAFEALLPWRYRLG